MERLRQETLYTTCAVYDLLIFFRKFFHTQDGNDVLKFLVALKGFLYALRTVVVIVSQDIWREDSWSRVQRIHSRVDTQFSDLTRQYRSSIQVSECGRWSRVSQVIRRYVNGLYGSDRTIFSRGDSFLHGTHLCCQSWLVTYCRRHTSKKCGHFGTCLCESENVVDKEQDVFSLTWSVTITVVFRKGKTSKGHASTCSWRLVHLSKHECCFGVFQLLKVYFR